MIYRLYIETKSQPQNTAWAFSVFNHQDFRIYKLTGLCEHTDEKAAILETAVRALTYFSNFIRRRYYDEHFATILDEDNITLFSHLPDIENAASVFPSDDGKYMRYWTQMRPFLERDTMFFQTTPQDDVLSESTLKLIK